MASCPQISSSAAKTKSGGFLDSNLLLYLLSADDGKADQVEAQLKGKPVISVQVLNEVTSVCRRKLKLNWSEIESFLTLVQAFCNVQPVTLEVHELGRRLAERYQLSFYDACIAAAAMGAGCSFLYTEDLHDGLMLDERLLVRNPFRN